MLSFLGATAPICVRIFSLNLLTGLQSVFHAAMLGDISLIQLWTNNGERIRFDEKHPVTGAVLFPSRRACVCICALTRNVLFRRHPIALRCSQWARGLRRLVAEARMQGLAIPSAFLL